MNARSVRVWTEVATGRFWDAKIQYFLRDFEESWAWNGTFFTMQQ
jgi:hypothetical protein